MFRVEIDQVGFGGVECVDDVLLGAGDGFGFELASFWECFGGFKF